VKCPITGSRHLVLLVSCHCCTSFAQELADVRLTKISPEGVTNIRNYVFASDNRIFATRGGRPCGFDIIDPTYPSDPVVIGSYTGPSSGMHIYVESNTAYFGECCDETLVIADVSCPTQITILARYTGLFNPEGISVVSNFLYLADYICLRIFDVSTPTNPVLVSSHPVPGCADDVDVVSNYVFVTTGTTGVEVIDISNKQAPTTVLSTNLSMWVTDVMVVSNLAYVSGNGGLRIFNIVSPSNLVLIGSYNTNVIADMFLTNDLLYCAAGFQGIQVLNASDPTNVLFLAATVTTHFVRSLALLSNFCYSVDPFTVVENRHMGWERLSSVSVDPFNSELRVVWTSVTGRNYRVVGSSSLCGGQTNWIVLGDGIPGAPPLNSYTCNIPTLEANFFVALGIGTNN
jgi:hypothetical protein